MTIEIKNLQCISTLLANYADKIISINEGSSSNKRIESLIELAKKNGVKTISSKGDFSAICKQPIIQDIKDKDLDFGEVVLVLDEVQDTRNLGSCLRSASFFGVDSVIIPKNNSADFFNTAAIETSTGGIYDLKLFKATNINVVIEHLKKDGFWVSGFSEHAEASLEATNSGSHDNDFHQSKISTGQYFMERQLPFTKLHLARIRAGSDAVMKLNPENF